MPPNNFNNRDPQRLTAIEYDRSGRNADETFRRLEEIWGADSLQRNIREPYSQYTDGNSMMGALKEFEEHARNCVFFNGFSISKRHGKEYRDFPIVIRCSCGQWQRNVDQYLFFTRYQAKDMEDKIEEINYYNSKNVDIVATILSIQKQKEKLEIDSIKKKNPIDINAIDDLEI